MKRSYDTVAPFYDRFARLVFGQAQLNAQRLLLQNLQGTNILVIGGGTGWILEEIARLQNSSLHITYVDSSARMMDQARKRDYGNNRVSFVTGNVLDVVTSGRYDTVITPFLFDNLDQVTAGEVCGIIKRYLKTGGLWLYCDFEGAGTLWQRGMLGAMYLFFRACCGIKAKWMPDMNRCFLDYKLKVDQRFYGRFIVAGVYEKL